MSKIEWTEKTWNVSTGCNKVSEGCKHCYAEVMHKRQMVLNPEKYAHPFLDGAFPHESSLKVPLRWKKPAMIFVNSMSDLFHENIPFEFIDKVYDVMWKCKQHTFQILTKRPERALEYYKSRSIDGLYYGNYSYGEMINIDDLYGANVCGYGRIENQSEDCSCNNGYLCAYPLEQGEGFCEHGYNLCYTFNCPIAYEAMDKKDYVKADIHDGYIFDKEGRLDETKNSSDWMILDSKPKGWNLPNVWIGTSVENQEQADKRIPYLLRIPAAVRFLSCEPLLGEVDLKPYLDQCTYYCDHDSDGGGHRGYNPLHWVIVGGESGHGARPMHPDWARKIRDDCQAAGVAFFFKQWGEWTPLVGEPTGNEKLYKYSDGKDGFYYMVKLGKKHTGRLLDGVEYSEYPKSEIVKGE